MSSLKNSSVIFLDFTFIFAYNKKNEDKMKTGNSEYRRGMGLKAKFSLWMVVFILTVMLTVSFFFIQHEKKILSNEIKLRGKTIALNVAANAEDPLGQKDDLILSSFVHDAKVNNKGVVYCFIVDNKNIIWASTEKFKNNTKYKRPAGLRPLKNESVLVQEYKKTPDEDVYDITAPIKIKNVKIGEVHLGISKKAIKKYLNETTKGMVVSTAIFLTIGVIGIFVLTSFIIGSVEEVTEDIEAIGNGDLNRVIEINRRDEIGRIAHSVKEMSRKLKLAQDDLVEKERMKKEMQIAKEIQQTLLPQSIPNIQGFQIETFYESANEVGGDYFDYIHIDETHFGILVADVSVIIQHLFILLQIKMLSC
ncbi:MAG: hypothetical protein B5M53_07785 [Candidatus Cloacimonas sp. 4484_209]|nr:MAG: hypothetical protein B5M53_07785 [Candidatus Cloacimonas sp. 4484_209]